MSMPKRIINIDNGTPPGPTTMAELLSAAEASWKAGEKQKAFVTMLGAMAMMSAGIAQAMKQSEASLAEVLKLKAKLAEKDE